MKPLKHLAAIVVIIIPIFVYVFIRATAAPRPLQPTATRPAQQVVQPTAPQNTQPVAQPTVAPVASVAQPSAQTDLTVVGTNFMTALKNKDYQTAHNLIEPGMSAIFTPANLQIIVSALAPGYSDIVSWRFTNVVGDANGPTSVLIGTANLKNGTQQPLVLTLRKVGPLWLVANISK